VTTTAEGVPELVGQLDQPGTYTVQETVPAAQPGGFWTFDGITCNGGPLIPPVNGVVTVVVPAENPQLCVAVSTFHPLGRVMTHKISNGGAGTFRYVVTPLDQQDPHQIVAEVTTPGDGVPAPPIVLDNLPLGRYSAQEIFPESTAGVWRAV